METKDDFILDTLRQFKQVATKFALIEEMPIPVDDGFEVTTKEAHTIEAIGQKQPMNITDVATTFGISRSAASQMVAKLCAKGLLKKNAAPYSEKELLLTLTPLGQKVFDAHNQFHGADQAFLLERLHGFSLAQIATISVLLEAIGDVIDNRIASRTNQ